MVHRFQFLLLGKSGGWSVKLVVSSYEWTRLWNTRGYVQRLDLKNLVVFFVTNVINFPRAKSSHLHSRKHLKNFYKIRIRDVDLQKCCKVCHTSTNYDHPQWPWNWEIEEKGQGREWKKEKSFYIFPYERNFLI